MLFGLVLYWSWTDNLSYCDFMKSDHASHIQMTLFHSDPCQPLTPTIFLCPLPRWSLSLGGGDTGVSLVDKHFTDTFSLHFGQLWVGHNNYNLLHNIFIFRKYLFCFIYVYVCMCEHVCTYTFACIVGSLGAGITGDCELPDMSAEDWIRVLCMNRKAISPLLTTESSLSSIIRFFNLHFKGPFCFLISFFSD